MERRRLLKDLAGLAICGGLSYVGLKEASISASDNQKYADNKANQLYVKNKLSETQVAGQVQELRLELASLQTSGKQLKSTSDKDSYTRDWVSLAAIPAAFGILIYTMKIPLDLSSYEYQKAPTSR
ncbi:MAG: hypothetical protein ACHQVK_01355 [Candidatus Paceibacterales bacterium]